MDNYFFLESFLLGKVFYISEVEDDGTVSSSYWLDKDLGNTTMLIKKWERVRHGSLSLRGARLIFG